MYSFFEFSQNFTMFSISFRKHRDKKKETNLLALTPTCFARASTTSTARASSVSPSSYTNTISARAFLGLFSKRSYREAAMAQWWDSSLTNICGRGSIPAPVPWVGWGCRWLSPCFERFSPGYVGFCRGSIWKPAMADHNVASSVNIATVNLLLENNPKKTRTLIG